MSYRCDYCHAMQYAETHECSRANPGLGGDQWAPGGLQSPRITREQATAKSRAAMASQAALTIQSEPVVEPMPILVPAPKEEQQVAEPPVQSPVAEPPAKSVTESLSEIDRLLAQGSDTSPKA